MQQQQQHLPSNRLQSTYEPQQYQPQTVQNSQAYQQPQYQQSLHTTVTISTGTLLANKPSISVSASRPLSMPQGVPSHQYPHGGEYAQSQQLQYSPSVEQQSQPRNVGHDYARPFFGTQGVGNEAVASASTPSDGSGASQYASPVAPSSIYSPPNDQPIPVDYYPGTTVIQYANVEDPQPGSLDYATQQYYTPEDAMRGIAADDNSLQETWQSYMNQVGTPGPRQLFED